MTSLTTIDSYEFDIELFGDFFYADQFAYSTWPEAHAACRSRGGRLLSIHSYMHDPLKTSILRGLLIYTDQFSSLWAQQNEDHGT